MAKVYYRKYKAMLDDGTSMEEVLALVNAEVPEKWRSQVVELLNDRNN